MKQVKEKAWGRVDDKKHRKKRDLNATTQEVGSTMFKKQGKAESTAKAQLRVGLTGSMKETNKKPKTPP